MFSINATGARVSGQCYPKVLYCLQINNFVFSTCLTGAKDSEQRYPRVLCCLQFNIFAFSTCLTGARYSEQCYPESRWRPGGGGLSPASSRSALGVFQDCSGTVPECSGVAPPIKQPLGITRSVLQGRYLLNYYQLL